jgi:hypothetical protein
MQLSFGTIEMEKRLRSEGTLTKVCALLDWEGLRKVKSKICCTWVRHEGGFDMYAVRANGGLPGATPDGSAVVHSAASRTHPLGEPLRCHETACPPALSRGNERSTAVSRFKYRGSAEVFIRVLSPSFSADLLQPLGISNSRFQTSTTFECTHTHHRQNCSALHDVLKHALTSSNAFLFSGIFNAHGFFIF